MVNYNIDEMSKLHKSLNKTEFSEFYHVCEEDRPLSEKEMRTKTGTKGLLSKELIKLYRKKYVLTKKGEQLQSFLGDQLFKTVLKIFNQ